MANMKYSSSKIMVVAIALVMALAMATTSAFAWLSMSNEAYVNDFNVTATSGDGLMIAVGNGEFKQNLTAEDFAAVLTRVYDDNADTGFRLTPVWVSDLTGGFEATGAFEKINPALDRDHNPNTTPTPTPYFTAATVYDGVANGDTLGDLVKLTIRFRSEDARDIYIGEIMSYSSPTSKPLTQVVPYHLAEAGASVSRLTDDADVIDALENEGLVVGGHFVNPLEITVQMVDTTIPTAIRQALLEADYLSALDGYFIQDIALNPGDVVSDTTLATEFGTTYIDNGRYNGQAIVGTAATTVIDLIPTASTTTIGYFETAGLTDTDGNFVAPHSYDRVLISDYTTDADLIAELELNGAIDANGYLVPGAYIPAEAANCLRIGFTVGTTNYIINSAGSTVGYNEGNFAQDYFNARGNYDTTDWQYMEDDNVIENVSGATTTIPTTAILTIDTESGDGYYYGSFDFYFWLEGTDGDCFDSVMNDMLSIFMRFESAVNP